MTRSFTFAAFCPAHPDAGLDVIATDPPGPNDATTRAHTRCATCGLGWTLTATCVPMKDHTAERLGIPGRHASEYMRLAAVGVAARGEAVA
jgi:hypothetical protein